MSKLNKSTRRQIQKTQIQVLDRAAEVLGSRGRARAWLRRPALGLGGQRPADLICTPEGAQQVQDLLGRLEYGVYT